MNAWRDRLRRLFTTTVAALDPATATAAELARCLPAPAATRLVVIAFGKAARRMAEAVVDAGPWASLRGLVVPPEPDAAPLPPFDVRPGGHPLPTAASLAAGQAALALAASATAAEHVVFLVSGGGSALLEVPLDPAVSLAELRSLHQALVGSGAPITAMNVVRRALSAVKGGRLARAAAGAAAQHTVAVSDVPAADLAALASGPTVPFPDRPGDARAVVDRAGLWAAIPAVLRRGLEHDALPAGPGPAEPLWRHCTSHLALDPERALHTLVAGARRLGLHVVVDDRVDDLPYDLAAARLLHRLDRLRRRRPGTAVAVATVGELAVTLPPDPGCGGRNQHFALHCARAIRGRPITVLSAGTDGIDGNSPAAGAVVDGTTATRARALGLSVPDALQRFASHPLLAALGDTVTTGPTGTNLRDLRLLVHTG